MKRMVAIALFALFAGYVWGGNAFADELPPPKRPLVFIPGLIGSELWSGNERLWGGLSDITHLDRLAIEAGPRDVVPLNTCSDTDSHDDRKRQTCGPIEAFSTLPPFSVDQYAPFFRFLESLGYKRNGPDKNLFVFSYDWRRSNFQTADDFRNFVNSQTGLSGKPFDILAHSMGGLVAIIFTHKYDASPAGVSCLADTCRVQTLITLGTPFWGSMSAISTLDTGWGAPWNWIAGGQDTIRKTVLSWPSVYEMLPTYEDCCFRQSPGNARTKIDLFQYEQWQTLPFVRQDRALPEANVKQHDPTGVSRVHHP